ncbi:hypothetical protein CBR_g32518 [Chara braunii]|uniref:acetate--CoA ligase n=1 Tax=Chara braunii TaxID=69332 RepID=A0A388LGS6_CHABU|nr:hypothetical protein CBR_g32518 [Chara braunii]|eukprot:GBG81530.1 hypothetical protein CBR_g32518 [Chara braunii]
MDLMDFEQAASHMAPPDRGFAPPQSFVERAHVKSRKQYEALHSYSLRNPKGFWSEMATPFTWKKPWTEEFSSYNFDTRKGPVDVKWFIGAETNVCYNAIDRHIKEGNGDRVALYWEGNNPGVDATFTYKQLHAEVCKIANYLKSVGVERGDTVSIYLPMLPELVASMLACARIGVVHSVVFAGFSSESLAGRLKDSQSRVLLTATAVMRGTKLVELKKIVLEKVLVFDNELALKREESNFVPGRDVWWQEAVNKLSPECEVEWVDAEAPLFMLYTSGSTGKPKGVLHTTAGYMVGAATTFKYIFDHHPDDIFWCTADCGWITGHSYLTYGPLLNGASVVMFEGIPTHPDPGRCWEVVDKYNVTVFYTAPTAIRALMRCGDEVRMLWYHSLIGHDNCPIADTWWQTETGSIMISPLPGAWPLKPGCATLPFFGVDVAVLDENGKELEGECSGYLVIKSAWPSCMRTVKNDHERFEQTYFSAFEGYYFTGDGCKRDQDGFYWLTGRVDDVINAAVVGYEHAIKGQGIYAFVTLMEGVKPSESLKVSLRNAVRNTIGAFASPDVIHWAPGLPKTRSGKIMRRILRKIASGELSGLGDISTLADPTVVDTLIKSRDLE